MHRWLSVAKVGGVVAQTVTQWASSVWAVASILGRLGLAGVSGLVCLRSGFLQVWRGGGYRTLSREYPQAVQGQAMLVPGSLAWSPSGRISCVHDFQCKRKVHVRVVVRA